MPTPTAAPAPAPIPFDVQYHRAELCRQRDHLQQRVEAAEQAHTTCLEQGEKDIEAARAAVPELGDTWTELEWLTFRAAQADRDLVQARYTVTAGEKLIALETLLLERDELDARIGHIDHLVEDGLAAAGNDTQLAILMLDVQEAAAERQNAYTALDYARRRLTLTKRMHREIHAALRRAQRDARSN